jgi:hypothetical protein
MIPISSENWKPADLSTLVTDVIDAVESAIGLPREGGNPDIEIYIKVGNKVLYGEKVLPRGILTENFLSVTGSSLL